MKKKDLYKRGGHGSPAKSAWAVDSTSSGVGEKRRRGGADLGTSTYNFEQSVKIHEASLQRITWDQERILWSHGPPFKDEFKYSTSVVL